MLSLLGSEPRGCSDDHHVRRSSFPSVGSHVPSGSGGVAPPDGGGGRGDGQGDDTHLCGGCFGEEGGRSVGALGFCGGRGEGGGGRAGDGGIGGGGGFGAGGDFGGDEGFGCGVSGGSSVGGGGAFGDNGVGVYPYCGLVGHLTRFCFRGGGGRFVTSGGGGSGGPYFSFGGAGLFARGCPSILSDDAYPRSASPPLGGLVGVGTPSPSTPDALWAAVLGLGGRAPLVPRLSLRGLLLHTGRIEGAPLVGGLFFPGTSHPQLDSEAAVHHFPWRALADAVALVALAVADGVWLAGTAPPGGVPPHPNPSHDAHLSSAPPPSSTVTTHQSWIPSPVLSVHINNIHRCKHGSDTESYNTEGRFEPSKFDAIFSKYALTHPDALTSEEISTMLQVNRNVLDFIGWVASIAEWRLLYQIGKDEDGLLHKETIRGAFDGSLFEQLEKNRASRTKIV